MSTTNGKRRLALMPEVLPAPVQAAPSGRPSPRSRALARLKVLGAVSAGLAACGKATEDSGPVQQTDAGPDAFVDGRPSSVAAKPYATAYYARGPRDAGSDANFPDAETSNADGGPNGSRFVELTIYEFDGAVLSITADNAIVGSWSLFASTKPPALVFLRIDLEIADHLDATTVSIARSCCNDSSTITVKLLLKETRVEATLDGD